MSEEEIDDIIQKEFEELLKIDEKQIEQFSFAEACMYVEALNRLEERRKELKKV